MNKRQQQNWNKQGRPKKRKETNIDRIKEINRQALKAGMSYGKFVAKYGYMIDEEV